MTMKCGGTGRVPCEHAEGDFGCMVDVCVVTGKPGEIPSDCMVPCPGCPDCQPDDAPGDAGGEVDIQTSMDSGDPGRVNVSMAVPREQFLQTQVASLEASLAAEREQRTSFIGWLELELEHWNKPGATGGPMLPPVSEDTRQWLARHTKQILDFAKIELEGK